MKAKRRSKNSVGKADLSNRVIALVEEARGKVAKAANVALVYTYYEVGRRTMSQSTPRLSSSTGILAMTSESGQATELFGLSRPTMARNHSLHRPRRSKQDEFYTGKMWLGNTFGHFWFMVPDDYEAKATDFRVDPDGSKWRRIGNICWFTNLDFPKRHEPMPLRKEYSPEAYRKCDEYDAIEVARVDDIPCGYDGRMGVPITFLTRHNPEQFDIVGLDRYVADNPRRGYRLKLGGRETYARLIIKKRVVP